MKSFNELEALDLRWEQPNAWKARYELRSSEGELIAVLTRRSWWRQIAEIESLGNRWRFERKGFWRQRIEITSVGTGESPATFEYALWRQGGRLIFPDGRSLRWGSTNFWNTKWAWMTEDGTPVVGFRTGGLFKVNSEVDLDPMLAQQKSLPLLVMLGWYLILLQREDAGSSAVVVGG